MPGFSSGSLLLDLPIMGDPTFPVLEAIVLPGIGFAMSLFFAGSVASAALGIAFLAVVAAGKREPYQHEEQAI